MIELGSEVRDKITGFRGVAIVRSQYINGCDRYAVQTRGLHEGKPVDAHWFDENQLEAVEDKATEPIRVDTINPGGPRLAPSPRIAER